MAFELSSLNLLIFVYTIIFPLWNTFYSTIKKYRQMSRRVLLREAVNMASSNSNKLRSCLWKKVTSIAARRRCRTSICLCESFFSRMFAIKSFGTGDPRLFRFSNFPARSYNNSKGDRLIDSDILLFYMSSCHLSRKDSVCFTVRSCFWEGIKRACSCKLFVYSANSSSFIMTMFVKRYQYNHMAACHLFDHNSAKN